MKQTKVINSSKNGFAARFTIWNQDRCAFRSDKRHLPYYEALVGNFPLLRMKPYDSKCDTSLTNFVAFMINSVQREIADMCTYILPTLAEYYTKKVPFVFADDLMRWWKGFTSYFIAVGNALECALQTSFKQNSSQFAKLDPEKRCKVISSYEVCMKRLLTACEIPLKALELKIKHLSSAKSLEFENDIERAWSSLATFLLQVLDDVYEVSRSLEIRARGNLPLSMQKKIIREMLIHCDYKIPHSIVDHQANVLICLTRWMQNADAAMDWVQKFCPKRAMRVLGYYAVRYDCLRKMPKLQLFKARVQSSAHRRRTPRKVTFDV